MLQYLRLNDFSAIVVSVQEKEINNWKNHKEKNLVVILVLALSRLL